MRIDSHNHFWQYDPKTHAWIDESMSKIRRDFMPEEFEAVLSENGFDGTIAVQADQSEQETTSLLALASEYDVIKGVVGWIDLSAENVSERLAHFSQFEKLVGLRHIVQAEPDPEFMLRKEFQRGIGLLKAYNLAYDILVFPYQLAAVAETISLHPSQKFVIDHLAKPYIKKKEIGEWAKFMKSIGKHENVMCKLSGMVTEADWDKWHVEDFKPYLDIVLEAFGIDRVMFGSDWPVCLVSASYQQVKEIVEDYVKEFSEEERAKVFGTNAMEFYGIK
ncbi:MAG: amidohydrolase family protein [Bacteroidota bacterium]